MSKNTVKKPFYRQVKRVEHESFPERARRQKTPVFYITTTLPYVNGKPHIGFALEAVQADVLARTAALRGEEVVFNTGTDEHGQKILRKAEEEGVTPQEFCDRMSEPFRALKDTLGICYTHFIRTTDPHHVSAAQEFWRRCETRGDIYKKQYQTKYCVGCEMEKTDSDLDRGVCPDHPTLAIETVEEENYFFRFSKYQDALLELYAKRPDFVVPGNRLTEIRNFVAKGLQDFSISRLSSKMPWGIPVPGDEEHVMYVWFDALVNYISTLGWPARIASRSVAGVPEGKTDLGDDVDIQSEFERFWPGVQIAGKDNLRQQSAMWPAMLLSAGLEPPRRILIHGYILVGGEKMSKSRGNVISPDELIETFGTDGARYLLLSAGNLENDPDITIARLTGKYNADLANGLGNLVSRVLKLSEKLERSGTGNTALSEMTTPEEVMTLLETYRFGDTMEWVMSLVREANRHIDEEKPWELAKTDTDRFDGVMHTLLDRLALIASALRPLLPETSERIFLALRTGKTEPLFKRIG